jgi:phage tail sheath protein FI
MAEFLAPGVYIEEVPGSVHPIEGVGTSTGGLVGAAHAGPIDAVTDSITSLNGRLRTDRHRARFVERAGPRDVARHGRARTGQLALTEPR